MLRWIYYYSNYLLDQIMPHPLVVSKLSRQPYDVYVGRPSKWGNPFKVGSLHADGTVIKRGQAIDLYEEWLLNTKEGQALVEVLRAELKGKVLACWCSPLPCHADLLAVLANY